MQGRDALKAAAWFLLDIMQHGHNISLQCSKCFQGALSLLSCPAAATLLPLLVMVLSGLRM